MLAAHISTKQLPVLVARLALDEECIHMDVISLLLLLARVLQQGIGPRT